MGDGLRVDALVLYKQLPARVLRAGDKLIIEFQDGSTRGVRPKDVSLLHEGPMNGFRQIEPLNGDMETAWSMLVGEDVDLWQLTDLVFGTTTPQTVWSTFQLIQNTPYFSGEPAAMKARSEEELQALKDVEARRVERREAWDALLQRVRRGEVKPEDRASLQDVEQLALGLTQESRVLRELGKPVTPEQAHALLLRLGVWEPAQNPYPRRFQLNLDGHEVSEQPLPQEERVDLTHLPAFAIDDEGNEDPDDAISLEGDRLWVHVADVAALVPVDSVMDRMACERGANLYLPEGVTPMLPFWVTRALGLGLHPVSFALSFGFTVDDDGAVSDLRIIKSCVRVTRMTYAEAETQLHTEPLAQIKVFTDRFRQRRRANHAALMHLPEVRIRWTDGAVSISPIDPSLSREMVTDAMLMAGEAVGRYAAEHHLPLPFTMQSVMGEPATPETLADMYAYRKRLQASQVRSLPDPHVGLGLDVYVRCTSPLRRYGDLATHQVLRAHLDAQISPEGTPVHHRVAVAEEAARTIRRVERLSNLHWTLVALAQMGEYQGKAVVVEIKQGKQGRGVVIIPDLGLECQLLFAEPVNLNQWLEVRLESVDLAHLNAVFRHQPRST